ncbi:KinB-signaling pathway activation protein [Cohnella sp. CFH 77786]|uniref:KinB-signaling pathway activation protein n=1 Tax=Cohnella sp. CFH 77786 TaxID=2662265 RepID=UPI001C60A66F|nr:KinB-signaling pathway activation protein [Cohnella sp. CFH 77786]
MNLRKWMRLFGVTILIGGAVSVLTGIVMKLADPTFVIPKADDWVYNIFNMFLSGLTLGAFAHMGFFAYLTLNYIARSIFKRPYLWVAFQGFVVAFVLVEVAVNMYGTNFPSHAFWLLPVVLTACSALVAWRKAKETSKGAWIPSLFFMIAITVLESNPAFRTGSISALVYMLLPLFVCNTYQIMRLHRILDAKAPVPGEAKAG